MFILKLNGSIDAPYLRNKLRVNDNLITTEYND